MNKPLIEIQHLSAYLDPRHNLTISAWQFHPGEHWAIVGGNSSGKTAFAKLLLGELPVSSGQLDFADNMQVARDIAYVAFDAQMRLLEQEARRDISDLMESAFDEGTTAAQYVLRGRQPDEDYRYWLQKLGLAETENRGVRYLSTGQLRKVFLLRALLSRPQLLILDNPIEGLDRQSQEEFAEILEQLMHDNSCSLLLLLHRLEDLPTGITHIALMRDLSLVVSGSRQSMLAGEQLAAFRRYARDDLQIPEITEYGFEAPRKFTGGPLLRLEHVSAGFQGRAVLEDINWTMHPGDHVLIEGPNGCGKSTLLDLISGGNHKAYGQQVWLFGRKRGSGETLWEVKQLFGVVSQAVHRQYLKGWSALEVVLSGFYDSIGLYQDYGANNEALARAWLQCLDLAELQNTLYHRLSFGQQQLLLIARAMVKSPPILILDEPCIGLDAEHRQRVIAAIDAIAASKLTSIIYVSHTRGECPQCINRHLRFERVQPDQQVYQLCEVYD